MKNILVPILVCLMAITTLNAQDDVKKIKQLQIGDKAPKTDIVMKGVNGYDTSIKNEAKKNGVMVIFSCNTCPYVLAWENRYNLLAANSEANQIGFIVINSNEAQRNGVDSYEAMEKKAKDFDYKFPYVVDTNHEIADAFGATKTPDVFLFNSDMELVYKGAIDDNQDMANVDHTYLANAAVHMVQGKVIDPTETKAVGCTIKRLHKVQLVTE